MVVRLSIEVLDKFWKGIKKYCTLNFDRKQIKIPFNLTKIYFVSKCEI